MVVIYAEKFSLAKNIASALGAGKRIPNKKEPVYGSWEFKFKGEDAVLVYGRGHLVELSPPEAYDEKYKKWDINAYPIILPTKPLMEVGEDKKIIYSEVCNLFKKADWLICATDPDREGELIFYRIYKQMNCTKPWKRALWQDETAISIQKAFDNLIDGNQRVPEQEAGIARSVADYTIGMNLTVAMTQKSKGINYTKEVFSLGRVQTAVLNMVIQREQEIKGFAKNLYWKCLLNCSYNGCNFIAEHIRNNFENKNEADLINSKCNGTAIITDIKTAIERKSAPALFNSTQLRIECYKRYGWDIAYTDKVMQDLYEHKRMTYPRSSTEHLPTSMIPEVKDTIKKLMQLKPYIRFNIDESEWLPFTKKHFDDDKVGSHNAIIPTNEVQDLDKLSPDEQRLYDILARRLLSIVVPQLEIEKTTITIDSNGEEYKVIGRKALRGGWAVVTGTKVKQNILPVMNKGDVLMVEGDVVEYETKPKPRYTKATLMQDMETAGKKIEDSEARALMLKNKMGLGTEATRTEIISKLIKQKYIEEKESKLYPTEKGNYLIEQLPVKELKSAEMTGEWEKFLNDISLNQFSFTDYCNLINSKTIKWYNSIVRATIEPYETGEIDNLICPFCGRKIMLSKDKTRYFCVGYKEGCKFGFYRTIAGKKLSEASVKDLLLKGKTNSLKGFKKSDGKKFSAALMIDRENCKVVFAPKEYQQSRRSLVYGDTRSKRDKLKYGG